jgi:acyl-CoA synthetase (AMP-forming)/AMP-acid ligase II
MMKFSIAIQTLRESVSVNPLWDLLESAVAASPNASALHTEERTYSFVELRNLATNIARELRDQGLRPGDVVATALPNAMDWMVTLAAAHEGLLSVSLYHGGQASDIGASVVIAVPDRLIVNPDPSIRVEVIDEQWIRSLEGDADPTPPRAYDGRDALVRLVLTSGTTGTSRAAEYNAGTMALVASGAGAALGHGGARVLNLVGFSTAGGIYQALANMALATPYVAINAVSDKTPDLIAEFGITVVIGATTLLARLCDAYELRPDISPALDRIVVVGSTPADSLLRRMATVFPGAEISIMYGSTEGGLVAVKNAAVDSDPRVVGHVVPHVQLEVFDEDGAALTPGNVGEVRYRSPELIERYYRDPAATAAAIRDGWFYPGDRAQFLDSGELMIVGRTDDVINIGGVKVDPVTLESIALAFPGTHDAAVYLVHDDKGLPALEMALVVDADDVLMAVDAVIRRDPTRVVPSVYRRVLSLPRNQMGKLVRHELVPHLTVTNP